jgi:primosomal protein N' (replication factor Y)
MKAQVLLPKIFNFPFTYNSNDKLLKTGDFVEVPFGQKKEVGVVWPGKISDLKKIKIKKITKKIDNFSLDQELIDFMNWFAIYNMMPLGLVLKMTIGKNLQHINNKD